MKTPQWIKDLPLVAAVAAMMTVPLAGILSVLLLFAIPLALVWGVIDLLLEWWLR